MPSSKYHPLANFIKLDANSNPILVDGQPTLLPTPVLRSFEDVRLLVEQNAPYKILELFAEEASQSEQWQFAHEYIKYLEQLAKAEAHNADLPVISKDEDGNDVLAEPIPLPAPPVKPPVKSVEDVLTNHRRSLFKASRTEKIADITVEVDGMVFDGDEKSTDRMNQRIQIMSDTDTYNWTLANNEVKAVTKSQLFSAFKLAVEAQSNLWN
jgi:hypothetical protein